ncbi:hypothetical protein [Cytobacillus purgationiresistens]|uniref:Uncharacterized protein n=1 Tax=Cytobacillus purgationiresistens TaxID=863449 RepID=A0ABU0AAJ7_9BACI|nr:hypothetical protein [Cytobacillus purgationiresistens]MDQ0268273.1 hypothetical protein [Cytobacillus purgationiresistens]
MGFDLFMAIVFIVGFSLTYYGYINRNEHKLKEKEIELEIKKVELEMKRIDAGLPPVVKEEN